MFLFLLLKHATHWNFFTRLIMKSILSLGMQGRFGYFSSGCQTFFPVSNCKSDKFPIWKPWSENELHLAKCWNMWFFTQDQRFKHNCQDGSSLGRKRMSMWALTFIHNPFYAELRPKVRTGQRMDVQTFEFDWTKHIRQILSLRELWMPMHMINPME